jgi:hypothetical protein
MLSGLAVWIHGLIGAAIGYGIGFIVGLFLLWGPRAPK